MLSWWTDPFPVLQSSARLGLGLLGACTRALQGLEAEWKLWQETGLGYPVSYQMRESSQGAAEERRALDLGPDIDLRPAGAERAEAPPARGGQGSAERLERSGRADSSERPDLEHPWDDPYDEAAAKETKRMLYDHYHKQVSPQWAFQQRLRLAMSISALAQSPACGRLPNTGSIRA